MYVGFRFNMLLANTLDGAQVYTLAHIVQKNDVRRRIKKQSAYRHKALRPNYTDRETDVRLLTHKLTLPAPNVELNCGLPWHRPGTDRVSASPLLQTRQGLDRTARQLQRDIRPHPYSPLFDSS